MEDVFIDAQQNGRDIEDSLHSLSKEKDSGENKLDCSLSKSNKLVTGANNQQTLVLNVKQLQRLQRSKSWIEDSFFRSVHVLDNWIPKHVVTVDEKYLRGCLELIHLGASQAAPCNNVSSNWSLGNLDLLSDSFDVANVRGDSTCNLSVFEFDSSSGAGSESMVISPVGDWIVGSIMDSKSMLNILKSPLLQQYGAYDGDAVSEKGSFKDIKESPGYDFMGSPGGLSDYSLFKLDEAAQILGNNQQGPEMMHERLIAMSSTNSTCTDSSSSSSVSATVTQGMLQCSWKSGKPHFIFSLDEQKVVYEAKLVNNELTDDKALYHIYMIHSRMDGEKQRVIHDNDSHLIGKMKVSTSFTLCPNNSKMMEREFVLFGCTENAMGELGTSRHDLRKSKGLSKKVAEVFRSSQSLKKRTISKFGGSSAIQDVHNNANALGGADLLLNLPPPNLELAAIIVKDNLPQPIEEKVGGWGLKFLAKGGVKQTSEIMESSGISSSCARDRGDCSTSMDVLIPADLHGGPRTRNGGPSSLVERWRSGGCCDCGGWDLGCPLSLFKVRSNNKDLSFETDTNGQCKFIDLFIQGSEKGAPPLRMVNVHNGLYFVSFQSTLSALQSLSIAMAFLHCRSPALRPSYNVTGLK